MDGSKQLTLRLAVISHIGCVRKNNEDNFYINRDWMPLKRVNEGARFQARLSRRWHLLGVCDGMGGLDGGERAAHIAVRRLTAIDRPVARNQLAAAMDSYALGAGQQIETDANRHSKETREGTTAALLYLTGNSAHAANLGDSRVYLLREGQLMQLTQDHSGLYRQFLDGQLTREQLRKHPKGNLIDDYIGKRGSAEKMFHKSLTICRGDCFLICSDGLTDLVPHDDITRLLKEKTDPMAACSALVTSALELGGKDNTTVMVIRPEASFLPEVTAQYWQEALSDRYTEITQTGK